MAEHTEGPYHADLHHTFKQGGRTYAFIHDGKSIVPLAAVFLGVEGCGEGEGRATAKLFAEAPNMLSLLQRAFTNAKLPPKLEADISALLRRVTTGDRRDG